jgi:hypothetical protein
MGGHRAISLRIKGMAASDDRAVSRLPTMVADGFGKVSTKSAALRARVPIPSDPASAGATRDARAHPTADASRDARAHPT